MSVDGISSWQIGKPAEKLRARTMMRLQEKAAGMHTPIDLPWVMLNKLIGGLRPGEVTILAGSPGSAKSYMVLSVCLECWERDVTWKYLPLEDDAEQAFWRMIGIRMNDWTLVDGKDEHAQHRVKIYTEQYTHWSGIDDYICENPRQPIQGLYGKYVPSLPWDMMRDWVGSEINKTRVIIVDPVSLIDFETEDQRKAQWKCEQDFIKDVVGYVSGSRSHVILVCHFAKRAGRNDDCMDDVQGSAGFVRFAHNVLLLRGHEEKESQVMVPGGYERPVEHKRTMYIAKTRNGMGSNHKVAFNFSERGPRFEEIGVFTRRK